jgi:polyhydroxybutyrate depolymerase
MVHKIIIIALYFGLFASTYNASGKSYPIAGNPLTGSRRGSFEFEGLKRTYHLYIPESFDKQNRIPLVMMLHGRGATGEAMILVTKGGLDKLADRDGFIVAYPDGIDFNWNDGRKDEEANDRPHKENINDVGFLSALIDTLIKEYNLDYKRIYVTGISNGAMMAYRLAAEISGKITAIAPVDGQIPAELFPYYSPKRPISVLAINNMDDPLVPFNGGEIIGGIRKIKLGKVISARESIMFWVTYNKCQKTPTESTEPDRDPKDGTRIKREIFPGGREGTEVILYSINGGGHTWPGGFQYLPVFIIGRTSRDMDANEVIWDFFKKHSR